MNRPGYRFLVLPEIDGLPQRKLHLMVREDIHLYMESGKILLNSIDLTPTSSEIFVAGRLHIYNIYSQEK